MSEPKSGDLQRRISELELQHEKDLETIRDLRSQTLSDRQAISDLRGSADADRASIRKLQDQRETDRASIAEGLDRERVLGADVHRLEEIAAADQVLIGHLEAEGLLDRDKIANLEVALGSARRIGAAMGVLMYARKVTDLAAFDLLREASQTEHRKLREIAEEVLLTGTIP